MPVDYLLTEVATFFLDLDGVIFKHGTMEVNENALKFLNKIKKDGHQIVFTTARKKINNNVPSLALDFTIKVLKDLEIQYDSILGDISSPRIVINDEGAFAVNHKTNSPLNYNFGQTKQKKLIPNPSKVYNSLLAMAWTSARHGGEDWEDADEYIQTILIARSLLRCKGIDHIDIVKSFRSNPNAKISHFGPGGLKLSQLKPGERTGAIYKLLESDENEYIAVDGITDGAAMRTLPLAAAFGDDFNKLVLATNRTSRITHASIEARLAAILVALRFRQIIFNTDGNHKNLIGSMLRAVELLGAKKHSIFFLNRCKLAANIIDSKLGTEKTLLALIANIGMKHFAWSTPIAAVFWSYAFDKDFTRWLPPRSNRIGDDKTITNAISGNEYITYNGELIIKGDDGTSIKLSRDLYSKKLILSDSAHFKRIHKINPENTKIFGNDRAMDVDTFFSIAYSLCAADVGIETIVDEAKEKANLIYDYDLMQISRNLLQTDMRC